MQAIINALDKAQKEGRDAYIYSKSGHMESVYLNPCRKDKSTVEHLYNTRIVHLEYQGRDCYVDAESVEYIEIEATSGE